MKKENQKEILEKLLREIINIREEMFNLSFTLERVSDYFLVLTSMISHKQISLIHEYFEILLKMIGEKAKKLESIILDFEVKVHEEIEKTNNHE